LASKFKKKKINIKITYKLFYTTFNSVLTKNHHQPNPAIFEKNKTKYLKVLTYLLITHHHPHYYQ